jgi:hypothetical protein
VRLTVTLTAFPATGRLPHTHAQIVQCSQDIGVTAQEPGHEDGEQRHDDTEDDSQSNHALPPLISAPRFTDAELWGSRLMLWIAAAQTVHRR